MSDICWMSKILALWEREKNLFSSYFLHAMQRTPWLEALSSMNFKAIYASGHHYILWWPVPSFNHVTKFFLLPVLNLPTFTSIGQSRVLALQEREKNFLYPLSPASAILSFATGHLSLGTTGCTHISLTEKRNVSVCRAPSPSWDPLPLLHLNVCFL